MKKLGDKEGCSSRKDNIRIKGYIKVKSLLNNKNAIKLTGQLKTPEKGVPLASSWCDAVIRSDKIKMLDWESEDAGWSPVLLGVNLAALEDHFGDSRFIMLKNKGLEPDFGLLPRCFQKPSGCSGEELSGSTSSPWSPPSLHSELGLFFPALYYILWCDYILGGAQLL